MHAPHRPPLASRNGALTQAACLFAALLLAERAHAAAQRGAALIALSASQERSLGVVTAPLRSSATRPLASLPGTFAPPPNGRAAVAAPFAGTVVQVYAVEGQPVSRGQILASVFSRDALMASADAAQATAEAQAAAQAQRRMSLLVSEGIAAGARGEEADARLKSAQAMLTAKSLSVRTAGADRTGRYTLRAPFAGRVAQVGVKPGMGLEAMAPAFLVDRTDRIQVQADLPAALAGRVKVGDRASVEGVTGHVVAVGSAIDPRTRSVPLLAEAPPRPDFIPGRLTRVELSDDQDGGVQTVSRAAVIRVNGRDVVFVRQARGYAVAPVQVVAYDGDQASLRTGLPDGTQVATRGVSQMKSLVEQ